MSSVGEPSRVAKVGDTLGPNPLQTNTVLNRILALPDKERWPFTIGLSVISINAGIAGLVCNSYLRRMCMLRGKGAIMSMIPMLGTPFITMQGVWQSMLVNPVLTNKLNCPICAQLRGGMLNFTIGSLYPMMLAVPINGALALVYHTIEIPMFTRKATATEFAQFWMKKLRYFKFQFLALAAFQTVLGMYIAGKQYEVAVNHLIPSPDNSKETTI